MIAAVQSANQISPASEKIYHQSNLVGDWKGTWTKNKLPAEIKVVNIKGNTAQIEYTHNGHTERGVGTVDGGTISYNNVTIATRDGKNAVMELKVGNTEMTGVLKKTAAPPADQNKLVGIWNSDAATGQSVSIQVRSTSGRNAQVTSTINGQTQQGIGTVYANAVVFGNIQISTTDGSIGKVTYTVGRQTLSLGVNKHIPPSSTSSVNVLA